MYLVMCNVIVIENLVDGILDLILINQAVEQDNAILRQAGYGIPQRLFDEEVIGHVGCCAADICVLDCDFTPSELSRFWMFIWTIKLLPRPD